MNCWSTTGSGNKWSLLDHRQDISDERRAERVSAVRPSSRNNRRGLNASVRFSCVVLVKSMHSFWVLIGRRPRERSAEAEAKNRSSRGLRRQNSREIDSELQKFILLNYELILLEKWGFMLRALHLENFRIVANHALRIERELVPCPVRILE